MAGVFARENLEYRAGLLLSAVRNVHKDTFGGNMIQARGAVTGIGSAIFLWLTECGKADMIGFIKGTEERMGSGRIL